MLPFILFASAIVFAQDFDRAAQDLAQRIAAVTGSGSKILFDVRNISSLGPAEATRGRQSLEAELRKVGLQLVTTSPNDAEAHVTLAENVQGYLWVAQIHHGEIEQVVMVAVARPQTGAQSPAVPALILHKQFVWSQSAPILDFALLPASGEDATLQLLLLEPERVALYRFDQSRWQFQEADAIPHSKPWPRDLRGRLQPVVDNYQIAMPGVTCSAFPRRTFVVSCEEDTKSGAWLLTSGGKGTTAFFSTARNYFSSSGGTDSGGQRALPQFFTAAILLAADSRRILLTGLDGQARLYEDSSDPVATFSGWGNDIAGIDSRCDASSQVLVTRSGDWTQPDAVQTYEIIERQAVAVSLPLAFDGPVTALWPSSDGKSVGAVVRNLKTGQYEAYTLTISCSR